MKRIILSTLVFCSFSLAAFSQNSASYDRFVIGLHAMPGMAWFKTTTSGIASDGSKGSFTYGAMIDLFFYENYAFHTGVDVTYKGGQVKYTTPTSNGYPSATVTLQQIEIPLALRLRTNVIGKLRYYGMFGFTGNIKIDTKIDPENTPIEHKAFGTSLLLGAGVEYPISGRFGLQAGLQFNNGFTTGIDTKVDDATEKARPNYLALNVGVLF